MLSSRGHGKRHGTIGLDWTALLALPSVVTIYSTFSFHVLSSVTITASDTRRLEAAMCSDGGA